MKLKEIQATAESLRRQAGKAVAKLQTELGNEGSNLVDAIHAHGEAAIYGKLMLEQLEPILTALESTSSDEIERKVAQYLIERNEFLTGMKPWVPNSTDLMDNLIHAVRATVLADLIEAFK